MTLRTPAIFWIVALTLMLGWIGPVLAQSQRTDASVTAIRLRDQATVTGPNLTLGQIARITGPLAIALSDTVIAPLPTAGTETSVTLKEIEQILTKMGLHRGKVTLGGFDACRVNASTIKKSPSNEDAPSPATSTGTAQANPMAAMEVSPPESPAFLLSPPPLAGEAGWGQSPASQKLLNSSDKKSPRLLSELVAQRIAALVNQVDAQNLRITYSPTDQRALAQEIGSDLIEIQPQGRGIPGRLPMVIRRYQGEQLTQTLHITADVATVHQALVTTRAISRGQTITAEDLTIEQVTLTTPGQPLTEIAQAQGQNAKALLRKGTVLLAEHVSSPTWVKRGDLISVRCVQGAIVVRTVGRAMEDGSQDQIIKVQNEKSRLTYQVRLTSPREGLMCDPAESSSMSDATARINSEQGGVR